MQYIYRIRGRCLHLSIVFMCVKVCQNSIKCVKLMREKITGFCNNQANDCFASFINYAARHRVVLWRRQFEYIFYLLHALPLCLKMLEGILHSLSFSRKKKLLFKLMKVKFVIFRDCP